MEKSTDLTITPLLRVLGTPVVAKDRMPNMSWPLKCLRIASLAIAATLTVDAAAQNYPNRPITAIMPFGSGLTFDIFARALTAEAAKQIGQPIVYENRPGANGRLGIIAMQKAKPDGYLVTFAQDVNLVAQPVVNPEFNIEVWKDYIPVAVLFDNAFALWASSSVPFRDIKGLISYAKANPGKLNFAVTPGSVSQTTAALLLDAAGIKATMVPYKQPSQLLIDVVEGRADLIIIGMPAIPYGQSGKLVALAAVGNARWRPLPNLPTLTESGLPVAASTWYTLIVAAGTPREAVTKLASAFNAARKQPAIQKLYQDSAFNPLPYLTPEEIGEKIRAQIRSDGPALRKAGIKFE